MSGHNKWANIKHRKGAQDAKRSKIFTKIIKELTIAARDGGGDLESNASLRTAYDKAKNANMPKDKIETAIKKGTGELEGEELLEISYEGYGPAGVALIISVVTDNKNRAAQEIRHLLSKNGGSLAESGAVAWNFERKAMITVPKEEVSDFDEFMMEIIEAGAEDISETSNPIEITTEPEVMSEVRDKLIEMGYSPNYDLTYLPKNTVKVSGNDAEKLFKLIDALEDNDDVQNVYGNYEVDDKEMERLASIM